MGKNEGVRIPGNKGWWRTEGENKTEGGGGSNEKKKKNNVIVQDCDKRRGDGGHVHKFQNATQKFSIHTSSFGLTFLFSFLPNFVVYNETSQHQENTRLCPAMWGDSPSTTQRFLKPSDFQQFLSLYLSLIEQTWRAGSTREPFWMFGRVVNHMTRVT